MYNLFQIDCLGISDFFITGVTNIKFSIRDSNFMIKFINVLSLKQYYRPATMASIAHYTNVIWSYNNQLSEFRNLFC